MRCPSSRELLGSNSERAGNTGYLARFIADV